MTGLELIAIVAGSGGLAGAVLTGVIALIKSRMDNRTQVIVHQQDANQEAQALALQTMQSELARKDAELARRDAREAVQEKEVAGLKVANFLTLQHLIAVDRHFAEGNPPPPPAIPPELLARLGG